jgi:hypothetical protein
MDQLDKNIAALKAAAAMRRRRAELARMQVRQPAQDAIGTVMPGPSTSTGESPRGWFARLFGG